MKAARSREWTIYRRQGLSSSIRDPQDAHVVGPDTDWITVTPASESKLYREALEGIAKYRAPVSTWNETAEALQHIAEDALNVIDEEWYAKRQEARADSLAARLERAEERLEAVKEWAEANPPHPGYENSHDDLMALLSSTPDREESR